ncbi:adenosine 3'-phospho 5'-phosphosulfate transporter 1 [Drosophila biarmipes]|uniref:adenosine 3'-phospho 5'-phosphosulfate transporter 1 n=1 Tax=Drosophila biarmipes TaxID=125945 RepID=UPI0007E7B7B9|nr:adenosine 3'-phospho 5'-phosphosulfate transporter 1 [Drosophila biarmipes]XP_043946786.1 adenosine 3'-phospho 5'-phosphosulfate transporter 1 [Drosophila biarmipes]XP_050744909.1 adenosine 3'-phospho 5'-phosphosulfate transporter 1 [Drosophila biarmipes]
MYAYKMGRVPELVICSFIVGSLLVIHFFSDLLRASLGGYYNQDVTLSQLVESQSSDYAWFLKLLVNCFGYSCVFVPGYLIYKYVGRTNYLERGNKTFLHRAINMCITGNSGYDQQDAVGSSADKERPPATAAAKRTSSQEAVQLFWCFGGLMISYLTWGVLQEKIMTQNYLNFAGESAKFKDSQFLVFSNRLLAFLVALAYLQWQPSPVRHRAPLYKYSYASFSNIMSAWFQYEALKFVNFPTQVLAKSCKIIPVMLMGKLMSKAKYESYEYVTALLISLGMIFFMSGSSDSSKASGVTTLTGIFLLSMYMVFDSFTANWQGSLFKGYGMTPLQMMCGVNLFSSIFTGASLSMQGGFMDSLAFATEHPKFVFDMVVLSVCSAVGQLFIYHTIDVFGPVVFTIIMTLRQAVAIMLSCFIYQHSISLLGIFGVLIVFVAIFLRVYCNQRLKAIRKRAEANKPKMAV